MLKPGEPENEAERLRALRRYNILDTEPEQTFDDIARLASVICDTPIALMGFIDEGRQWFKAKVGFDVTATGRDVAFCAHAILQPDMLVVPDARADERFAGNPFVTGDVGIRFYAGSPLVSRQGFALGTLCVIDRKPRELTRVQVDALTTLRNAAVAHLEVRRMTQELARLLARRDALRAELCPACAAKTAAQLSEPAV